MPHPSLGLPPPDVTAGHPKAAAALRAQRDRLARLALEATLRVAPHMRARYDDIALRQLLRDYLQHIEQLARALETGSETFVTDYGEWLVPIYRRRRIPMKDFVLMLVGLEEALPGVLAPDDAAHARHLLEAWRGRLRHHARLPGDHKGNPIVRFFWKGAGVADDGII